MSDLWPSYRERYLGNYTMAQLAALPRKATIPIVLPVGAIEQHGPHLPVATDALLGQAWLDAALPLLPKPVPCLVAPPITVGKSNEHTGFAGSLDIGATALRKLCLTIGTRLSDLGFRTLALLNTHGGNTSVLLDVIREMRAQLDVSAAFISPRFTPEVDAREAAYGIHAGQVETSLVLAAAEHLVQREKADCQWIGTVDAPGELRPEGAPATYSWVTADLSPTGTMGDATRATREDGQRWLEAGAASLAESITRLHQWARSRYGD